MRVTVIRGNDVLVKDATLEVLPHVGETLRFENWCYRVSQVEHTLSVNPVTHDVRIFIGKRSLPGRV
jgi:hypothetical protein